MLAQADNQEDIVHFLFFLRHAEGPWTIDQRHEVEVAYLLAKAYWGQGLGTEAAQAILHYGFEQLGLLRLICLIDPENQASIKVARNIGMLFEKEGKDEKGPFLLYSRNK